MRFDQHFIQQAVPHSQIIAGTFPAQAQFSVDTRTLCQGDIFVAVHGQQVDGHDFIMSALEKGAAGLIIAIDKKNVLKQCPHTLIEKKLVILVPDTVQALINMAHLWRAQFTFPVVAITGSVGKTSTKEVLASILKWNGHNVLASEGNQNTKIGISLTIMKMRSAHTMAIFEVGINKRGEMAQLVELLRPTTAIITGIGHCHMEGLGSLADIALEKRDIFKLFTEQNIGIVNGDTALISQIAYAHPVIKFGTKMTNQIQARKIRIGSENVTCVLKIYKEKFLVTLPKPHMGVVFNALAATAAAHLLGVPTKVIIQAIQQPIKVPGRFETRQIKQYKGAIINDCYNANPESMKAALLAFEHIETSAQKIAVLGDMLELGVNSPFWHRQLGRFLRKVSSLRHVILVGSMVQWTKKTAPVGVTIEMVPNWAGAVEALKARLAEEESIVLVKGSRGIGLRNLVDTFSEK